MNIKQKLSAALSLTFFGAVIIIIQMATVTPELKFLAFALFILGTICAAGSWALGLEQTADEEAEEFMRAVK